MPKEKEVVVVPEHVCDPEFEQSFNYTFCVNILGEKVPSCTVMISPGRRYDCMTDSQSVKFFRKEYVRIKNLGKYVYLEQFFPFFFPSFRRILLHLLWLWRPVSVMWRQASWGTVITVNVRISLSGTGTTIYALRGTWPGSRISRSPHPEQ